MENNLQGVHIICKQDKIILYLENYIQIYTHYFTPAPAADKFHTYYLRN